jgi:CheY-like chemotaxis protein
VRNLNILLAEDNPVNQQLAARLLERRGHRVTVAGNGSEAVKMAAAGRFDLVLMDVQMPEMDGLTAASEIRRRETAQGFYTPIIALTAHAMKEDRERFLASGMDDYLSKPIQMDALSELLSRLTSRAPRPPAGSVREEAVWNRRDAMIRVDQDEELLRDMILMFYQDLPVKMRQIREAMDRGDWTPFIHATHGLKGAAGNISAVEVYECCQHLEQAGREGRAGEAAHLIGRLDDALQALTAVLQKRGFAVTYDDGGGGR